MPMTTLTYKAPVIFHQLTEWEQDPALKEAVQDCVRAQQIAAEQAVRTKFIPNPQAAFDVSPQALTALLRVRRDVNGIRTDRHISNVVVFNDTRYENTVVSEEVAHCRRAVDRLVDTKVRALFTEERDLLVYSSGFFLYPPGGYMGWHTNSEAPGWRLYISWVEEPGKSFFRYRNPDTSEMVTSWDTGLNIRLFRVTKERLLWHAIYSETNRFSLGYTAKRRPKDSIAERVVNRVKRLLEVS